MYIYLTKYTWCCQTNVKQVLCKFQSYPYKYMRMAYS